MRSSTVGQCLTERIFINDKDYLFWKFLGILTTKYRNFLLLISDLSVILLAT